MLKNLIFIISGFIFGQGSMFLAQSLLLYFHKIEVIAFIGIGLGIVSLFQWIGDLGGIFILSKYFKEKKLDTKLVPFILARIIFLIICFIILLISLHIFHFNRISANIIQYGLIAGFIFTLNLTGIIDNLNLNKINGPLSGLPWFLAAFSAIIEFIIGVNFHGALIGISYSIGTFVVVFAQYLILKNKLQIKLSFSFSKIYEELKIGMAYIIGYISAQIYARILPILIDNFIDSVTAGAFIYVKNIINFFSQITVFIRRIEFAKLIEISNYYSTANSTIKILILKIFSQKFTKFLFIFSILIEVFLIIIFFFVNLDSYLKLLIEISIFLFLLYILWLITSSVGQFLIANGNISYYTFIMSISIIPTLIGIISYIKIYSLFSIYFWECIMYIFQLLMYIIFLFKRNKK